MSDRGVVEVQLGRPPRSDVDVAARCHLDMPVVIDVPPFLDDGTPFPTTYWLTCPLAVGRVGRIEASGGVARFERAIAAAPDLGDRYRRAMDRYEADRDARIGAGHVGPRPSGGVGGSHRGVKCLHAHLADFLAGNDNPIGETVADDVTPLDCVVACVVVSDGVAAPNPDWFEPSH